MLRRASIVLLASICAVLTTSPTALSIQKPVRTGPQVRPGRNSVSAQEPFVILQQGNTTWIQVHTSDAYCPGDPEGGHGGEATGGPDGTQTWCFENAVWPEDHNPTWNGELVTVPDSCGTVPPWDTNCWSHIDIRTLPSKMGIDFWHLDSYLGSNGGKLYNGNYCLWVGSDSLWTDGLPVECGTWPWGTKPGYGNEWNCIARLDLDGWTTTGTCTLAFDPRYDTECKRDYFYVDYYDGSTWRQLAMFNGSSNSGPATCGNPAAPNPDYYGSGDAGQPNSADWVTRWYPGMPAFIAEIPGSAIPDDPSFRWRFVSDRAWSDADGLGDTDGGAFIDNVLVKVDGRVYAEDFEDNDYGILAARGWTFPDPDGVLQAWHQEHDPDRPYEGDDGNSPTTCELDSSVAWRARPWQGYATGQPWQSGWHYRLISPTIHIPWDQDGTGCVVQYDSYYCCYGFTQNYVDLQARIHEADPPRWCTWMDVDGYLMNGGCTSWNLDLSEDLSHLYGSTADSIQVGWDLIDDCRRSDATCWNRHRDTEFIVDNVSIGFYDAGETIFKARAIDLLHDSFHTAIAAHNSFFDVCDPGVALVYSVPSPPPIPPDQQLNVDVIDKDGLVSVTLWGSEDGGETWIAVPMSKRNPGGDTYYGTFDHTDFGHPLSWPRGSEVWYYVEARDEFDDVAYFPKEADPSHPDHENSSHAYFSFSLLPAYPVDTDVTTLLLVDGFGDWTYDWDPCLEDLSKKYAGLDYGLEDIYEQTLSDAGYVFDKFDILGVGSNVHIHCPSLSAYDGVIWFTGPGNDRYLFDKCAQESIRYYLRHGGKMVLCGDRIAYSMDRRGGDSLGGEFVNGIMGCDYEDEMESPFDMPYVYLEATDTVYVFDRAIPLSLDSLLLYRECPQLKDMSYVVTEAAPDTGYKAQPLLYVTNYNPWLAPNGADGAIYVERLFGEGQCVFIDFDLSAMITHSASQCDGAHPSGDPGLAYEPGYYYGRCDLMRLILEDLFGLVPPGGGGVPGHDRPPATQFKWALGQNTPNPSGGGTEIGFEVARTTDVSIKIYNTMGQLVRTLEKARFEPGRYSVVWDGRGSSGTRVSSGVYFCKMEAGGFKATTKVLMLR
jgi:hypothetical protein